MWHYLSKRTCAKSSKTERRHSGVGSQCRTWYWRLISLMYCGMQSGSSGRWPLMQDSLILIRPITTIPVRNSPPLYLTLQPSQWVVTSYIKQSLVSYNVHSVCDMTSVCCQSMVIAVSVITHTTTILSSIVTLRWVLQHTINSTTSGMHAPISVGHGVHPISMSFML